jgi:hypothetical protein
MSTFQSDISKGETWTTNIRIGRRINAEKKKKKLYFYIWRLYHVVDLISVSQFRL